MYQRFKTNHGLKIMQNFALFFVAAMLLNVTSAMAQDIITLKTGDDIEALVEKVGGVEIEYRKWDNQTGPVYVIKTDKVFMIKYRNGTKEVFNTPTKSPQSQVEQVQQTVTPVTPLTPATPSSNDLRAEFYRIGDDDRAMSGFFKRHSFYEYADRFDAACRQRNSGKALLGVGLGLTGVGIIVSVSGVSNGYNGIVGSVISGIGSIFTIISIPVSASAGGKKKAIKNDFARAYFRGYTYQPELKFGTTANGIGLTLNF